MLCVCSSGAMPLCLWLYLGAYVFLSGNPSKFVCVYLFMRSNASVTGQCSVSVTLSLFLISWKLLLWVHENTAATEN